MNSKALDSRQEKVADVVALSVGVQFPRWLRAPAVARQERIEDQACIRVHLTICVYSWSYIGDV